MVPPSALTKLPDLMSGSREIDPELSQILVSHIQRWKRCLSVLPGLVAATADMVVTTNATAQVSAKDVARAQMLKSLCNCTAIDAEADSTCGHWRSYPFSGIGSIFD